MFKISQKYFIISFWKAFFCCWVKIVLLSPQSGNNFIALAYLSLTHSNPLPSVSCKCLTLLYCIAHYLNRVSFIISIAISFYKLRSTAEQMPEGHSTWPLAPRGELDPQGWNLSSSENVHPFIHPRGEHSRLFRRMEGWTENFTPRV
jgi:hypothetical protein